MVLTAPPPGKQRPSKKPRVLNLGLISCWRLLLRHSLPRGPGEPSFLAGCPSQGGGLEELLRTSFRLEPGKGCDPLAFFFFFCFFFQVPLLVCSDSLENWVLVC